MSSCNREKEKKDGWSISDVREFELPHTEKWDSISLRGGEQHDKLHLQATWRLVTSSIHLTGVMHHPSSLPLSSHSSIWVITALFQTEEVGEHLFLTWSGPWCLSSSSSTDSRTQSSVVNTGACSSHSPLLLWSQHWYSAEQHLHLLINTVRHKIKRIQHRHSATCCPTLQDRFLDKEWYQLTIYRKRQKCCDFILWGKKENHCRHLCRNKKMLERWGE